MLRKLFSPQVIFVFIEGSPVNKSVKYQNRGTIGVQIPFSFPKSLDFKPFQAKIQVLPWQMNNIFITVINLLNLLLVVNYIFSYQSFLKQLHFNRLNHSHISWQPFHIIQLLFLQPLSRLMLFQHQVTLYNLTPKAIH